MRTFVSPIGYDSTRVTRPLLRQGLQSGDTVVLLQPAANEDNQRSEEALQDIERILQELEPRVTVTAEHITHDDLEQAVFECLDILQAANGDITANFGGGPREIYLAFAIAVLAFLTNISAVTQFSDITGNVSELELPLLTINASDTGLEILQIIKEEGGNSTVPEITDKTTRSKSTVTRHLSQLEDQAAIQSEMHGKTKYVELTFTGELLLQRRG